MHVHTYVQKQWINFISRFLFLFLSINNVIFSWPFAQLSKIDQDPHDPEIGGCNLIWEHFLRHLTKRIFSVVSSFSTTTICKTSIIILKFVSKQPCHPPNDELSPKIFCRHPSKIFCYSYLGVIIVIIVYLTD